MIDWTHWHNEPFLVGGLVVLGWWYALWVGPLRGRLAGPHVPFPRGKAVKFYAALFFFYLGVGSPLDQVAERYLFSAHMAQHQLIVYPAAILFLLGLPDWLVRPLTANAHLQLPLRILTNPVVTGFIYVTVISGWHLPFMYDWALQDRVVHIVEHFMFFGAALLYWWPICSPSKEFPPTAYAWQMFYFVAVTIGMTPVFAYITFSQDVLYPTYEFAPRITPLSPIQDQVLAGTMMKLIGLAVSMTAFGVSFYRWYQLTESKPRSSHPLNSSAPTPKP